ncbi:MAG: hypothetical protein FWG70_06730 [Oscillospiraceae bacterium]|nr:hypothetical protein [Oscillospiraceae bacterium]
MKVTKILALIITLAMSLTLAACGETLPNNDSSANNQNTNAETPDNGVPANNQDTQNTNAETPYSRTETRPPLYLPETFITHESDADFFYALTDNYVAYVYNSTLRVGKVVGINAYGEEELEIKEYAQTVCVVYFFDEDDVGLVLEWYQGYGEGPMPAVFAKKSFTSAEAAENTYSPNKGRRGDETFFLADNVVYSAGNYALQLYDIVYNRGNTPIYNNYDNMTKAELLAEVTSYLEVDGDRLGAGSEHLAEGSQHIISQDFDYEIYVSQP